MNKKLKNFAVQQKNYFLSTFRSFAKYEYVRILILDIIMVVSMFLLFYFSSLIITSLSDSVLPNLIDIVNKKNSGDSAFASEFAAIEPFVAKVLFWSVLTLAISYFLGLMILSATYDRTWNILRNIKVKFWKLVYFNFVWYTSWIVLMFITLAVFVDAFAAILLGLELFLFPVSDFAFRAYRAEKNGAFKSLIEAFKLLYATFPSILLPLIFIMVCILILLKFTLAIATLNSSAAWLFIISLIISFMAVLSIARSYFYQLYCSKK